MKLSTFKDWLKFTFTNADPLEDHYKNDFLPLQKKPQSVDNTDHTNTTTAEQNSMTQSL
ncbi:MAG: hypothetical protein R3E13_05070 [Alphaproteobacteria bacterium]